MLAVARAFEKAGVQTNGTVYFVGNVGEEGPGNLRGMRNLFGKELKGKIDYFISVDDAGLGIASRAVGSNRYRVTYKGPGGHSYGAFGIPNPIHALGRAIAGIADIQVPTTPKTTFNVGVIQGGTSVNSISVEAIDGSRHALRGRRSRSPTVDAKVQTHHPRRARRRERALARAARGGGEALARRSTRSAFVRRAARPTAAPIVQTALAAGKALGFTSSTSASSTDANIPISLGIPAIRIGGGGDADGAHSLGEWYDDGPNGYLGPQWAALLVAALAGVTP